MSADRRLVGAAMATMLAYYGYSTWRRWQRGCAPVPVAEDATLQLVNVSPSDAAALSSVLSSWAGPYTPRLVQVTSYDFDVASLGTAAQCDVEAAFRSIGAAGPCVTLRIGVTFGTEKDAEEHDATWGTTAAECTQLASRYGGCSMTVTCYIALCDRVGYSELFKHSVTGVVCGKQRVDTSYSSLEDLLVLSSSVAELMPRLSHMCPVDSVVGDSVGYVQREMAAARPALTSEQGHGLVNQAVLLRPHRWRAAVDLAFALMYRGHDLDFEQKHFGGVASIVRNVLADVRSVGSAFALSLRRAAHVIARRKPTFGCDTSAVAAVLRHNPKHPLCGRFENHITIDFDPENGAAECERFLATSRELGIKVVSIALPKGAKFPAQVMTSYYATGHVKECTLALLEMGVLLSLRGFSCVRLKMEAQLTEDLSAPIFTKPGENADRGLCPVSDELAADSRVMSPKQYYEFHVKLGIPQDKAVEATPLVQQVGREHNAHLSKNAFKVYASGAEAAYVASTLAGDAAVDASPEKALLLYFLTLRVYRTGFSTCIARMKALVEAADAALRQVGGRVTTVQREYSVFDTNTGLDAGWFERSAATPSFMLDAAS